MQQGTTPSLGAIENPWPSWAIVKREDVQDACACAGKTEEQFYGEFLPALVDVVRSVERVLRNSGREDTREFCAQNILSIRDGEIYIRAFTCVNGRCHVPAEMPFATGIGRILRKGWGNVDFDFTRES